LTTYAAVQDAIYAWVSANIGGATAIFSDQDAQQPDRPYVTIKLLPVVKLGVLDEERSPNEFGIAKIVGHREVTASIQSYGPGAMQLAYGLQDSLQKRTILDEIFFTNGMAVVNDATITNLSEDLETEIEERALLEVMFRYPTEQNDDVGVIESVEVENESNGWIEDIELESL
jgi:hypothetical protein